MDDCLRVEQHHADALALVAPPRRASARNLLHYVALRQHDLRELQDQLAELGLSSLGRLEAHVLATLTAVHAALSALCGLPAEQSPSPPLTMREGARLLESHAGELFGERRNRATRIMVTMPSEAASDPSIIRSLLEAGMDVLRINTAHDDPDAWERMIEHLRRAQRECDRPCRVLVDLAGPKARTCGGFGVARVAVGDVLILSSDASGPTDAVRDESGTVIAPASVGVSPEEVINDPGVGAPVWFDDGKIGAVVTAKAPGRLELKITAARGGAARLRGEKGINLPGTPLQVQAITPSDRAAIPFAASHADMVGFSFVRTVEDVQSLIALLREHDAERLAIILKIETRQAFESLPQLLLGAMRSPPVGVMLARGDLGVELGFERLAEVQEEILWLSEAAHVPVIWATQVLDSLARKGLPSRAEVTDAAMSGRAECVMLNKGPMVVQAVRFLDDVLRRMSGHQCKKTPVLRPLGVARGF
jgi:pyruvate kinase